MTGNVFSVKSIVKMLMRRVECGSIQREGQKLRVLYMEAFEDHLRMALIRHGDSVIVVLSGYP